jgi:hypothetical protein
MGTMSGEIEPSGSVEERGETRRPPLDVAAPDTNGRQDPA